MSNPENSGERQERLHQDPWVCPEPDCGGELSYAVEWHKEGPAHWWIDMRCPECDEHQEGVFHKDAVERLDDECERRHKDILRDLGELAYANMEEEVNFFVRVLDADIVTAADFQS